MNSTAPIFPKGDPLPKDWFVGEAFLTPLLSPDDNNSYSVGSVWFEKGARTNWHTHPKGQNLLVTEGQGFYQEKGKPAQVIKKGDVIVIPENVEHWHGASADTEMVHVAITNFEGNRQVTWLHPVSEDEYRTVNHL